MQPRIYVYKITFVDQPYWYWGWHKEKKFDEYYMGSPVTNKRYWDMHEPVKEIVEVFEYSDEGALLAQVLEQSLIISDLNHPLCLNENCGGIVSLKALREGSKKRWKNPELRKKASETMTKNMTRLWKKYEHYQKISRAITEKWKDLEYRNKVSEAMRSLWEDLEYKERTLKNRPPRVRGTSNIPEKASILMQERWKDEECRAKLCHSLSLSAKKVWKDEEYREKMSNIRREKWKDEEYREKVLKGRRIPVRVLDTVTGEIKQFKSMREFREHYKIGKGNLSKLMSGQLEVYKGLKILPADKSG